MIGRGFSRPFSPLANAVRLAPPASSRREAQWGPGHGPGQGLGDEILKRPQTSPIVTLRQIVIITPAHVSPPPNPHRITRWPFSSLPLSFISAMASGMLAALVLA